MCSIDILQLDRKHWLKIMSLVQWQHLKEFWLKEAGPEHNRWALFSWFDNFTLLRIYSSGFSIWLTLFEQWIINWVDSKQMLSLAVFPLFSLLHHSRVLVNAVEFLVRTKPVQVVDAEERGRLLTIIEGCIIIISNWSLPQTQTGLSSQQAHWLYHCITLLSLSQSILHQNPKKKLKSVKANASRLWGKSLFVFIVFDVDL